MLIFQFPIWWFGLPAILKGWVDRVFAMERIYGGRRWFDDGYFKGRRAMLSLTTGGGPGAFSENGIVGDIHAHLHPINYGILRFVGFDVLPPFIAWGPARASDERRRANIEEYVARAVDPERSVATLADRLRPENVAAEKRDLNPLTYLRQDVFRHDMHLFGHLLVGHADPLNTAEKQVKSDWFL